MCLTHQEETLGMVCSAHRYALDLAREEKPSGDWPIWAVQMDEQLTAIERDLRREAKESR
jgi:hypothetical protein